MKKLLLGVASALLSVPLAAQFAPPAIVTTNIPDVDRRVAAARVAAGTEWVGLYEAACGDAVGLSQPPAARAGPGVRAGAPVPVEGAPGAMPHVQVEQGRGDAAAVLVPAVALRRARRGTATRSRCSTTPTTSA